jgi:heme/copper-type cytochrome/quinol oxidase subunit 2
MLAFALSMLNNDFHIIAAATFLVEQENEDALVQRAWEIHIQRELGRSGSGAGWIRTNLQLVTPYALPVLGTIGGMVLFLVYATGWQRCAIVFPLGLSVLFAITALDVRRGYWHISVRAKALAAEA